VNRPVRLRGLRFDLQDGILPGTSMQWSSDRQGKLGNGSVMERFLRPGNHVIALLTTIWVQWQDKRVNFPLVFLEDGQILLPRSFYAEARQQAYCS